MFDIGFPELLMISVVALLVIGPEKLPETIRTISLWLGRLQRSFSQIRREIEQEIGADEIRQQLHNESIMKDLEKTKNTLQEVQQDVNNTMRSVQEPLQAPLKEISPPAAAPDSDSAEENSEKSSKAVGNND